MLLLPVPQPDRQKKIPSVGTSITISTKDQTLKLPRQTNGDSDRAESPNQTKKPPARVFNAYHKQNTMP
jgi:hypothetical protein